MSHQPFKRITITGRYRTISTLETLKTLVNLLLKQGITIKLEEETASLLNFPHISTVPHHALAKNCDLIIVVGGDGSLLHAAHAASDENVPILGINRGRLGFLTDIHPQELEAALLPILAGEYHLEERRLLQATVYSDDVKPAPVFDALNDVVVYAGNAARMIEFEVHINQQFVCSMRADGLIASTPTGSTAYALSAGGPILYPTLNAVVLVPLAPHTLTSRPIVVNNNTTIELITSSKADVRPEVSCDGQKLLTLAPGGRIQITQKPQTLKLIHPKDYDYYRILRTKLQWGTRLENKELEPPMTEEE